MSSCVRNKRVSGGEKGCTDQIFALRNIIEQSIEWNAPLCIGFIDFKKAFDSIHYGTLRKILRHYGLPQKIVYLISILYQNFECSVLMGKKSDKQLFSKISSSPRLHLIPNTLQYSPGLYNETDNTECTTWYTMDRFSQLEDIDYADDIALLSTTANHLQKKAQILT